MRVANGFGLGYCLKYLHYYMQNISDIGDLFKSLIMEAILKKNRNNIEMSINFESLTIEDIFIVNKKSP